MGFLLRLVIVALATCHIVSGASVSLTSDSDGSSHSQEVNEDIDGAGNANTFYVDPEMEAGMMAAGEGALSGAVDGAISGIWGGPEGMMLGAGAGAAMGGLHGGLSYAANHD